MKGRISFIFLLIAFLCLAICIAVFTSAIWAADGERSSEDNLSSSLLRRRLFHLFDDIAGVDPKYKAPIPYGTSRKEFFVSLSLVLPVTFFSIL